MNDAMKNSDISLNILFSRKILYFLSTSHNSFDLDVSFGGLRLPFTTHNSALYTP